MQFQEKFSSDPDKMNNTRPMIKIFLFLYTEHTERLFSSNFAMFFFFYFWPHTKMLETPKWFSDCESVNSVVSITISRDYYSGAKTKKKKKKKKKTFKRTEKKKKKKKWNKIKSGTNKLLLWFLTVTCSWCLYLYFGSAIMLVTYFVNIR